MSRRHRDIGSAPPALAHGRLLRRAEVALIAIEPMLAALDGLPACRRRLPLDEEATAGVTAALGLSAIALARVVPARRFAPEASGGPLLPGAAFVALLKAREALFRQVVASSEATRAFSVDRQLDQSPRAFSVG
jgi:hypothetical protein